MSISFISMCRKKTNIQKQIKDKAACVKAVKAVHKQDLFFMFLPGALISTPLYALEENSGSLWCLKDSWFVLRVPFCTNLPPRPRESTWVLESQPGVKVSVWVPSPLHESRASTGSDLSYAKASSQRWNKDPFSFWRAPVFCGAGKDWTNPPEAWTAQWLEYETSPLKVSLWISSLRPVPEREFGHSKAVASKSQ